MRQRTTTVLVWRVAFWIVSGSLMGVALNGFGLKAAFGLNLPIYLAGLVIALYGLVRLGPGGFWLTVVSVGAAAALEITYRFWHPLGNTIFFLENYHRYVLPHVLVLLVGVLWGLFRALRGSPLISAFPNEQAPTLGRASVPLLWPALILFLGLLMNAVLIYFEFR
jgi:hypothetical protein